MKKLLIITVFLFAFLATPAQSQAANIVTVGTCLPNVTYFALEGSGPQRLFSLVSVFADCTDCAGLGVTSAQFNTLMAAPHNNYQTQSHWSNSIFTIAACPVGGDWTAYDTDADGTLNGIDFAPFDNTIQTDPNATPPPDPNAPPTTAPIVGSCALYTPSGDTFVKVFTDIKTSLNASPLMSGISGFFNWSPGIATCPTWSIPMSLFNVGGATVQNVDIDFQCSIPFLNVMGIVKGVLLLAATFGAYKWAFI